MRRAGASDSCLKEDDSDGELFGGPFAGLQATFRKGFWIAKGLGLNFFNFGSGTDGLMLPEQVIARGYDIDLSRNFVLKLGLEVGSDLSSSLRAIANVGVELRF